MAKAKLTPRLDAFWIVALSVLVLRAISDASSLAAYFIVIAYGIRGPRHAVEALMLSWFITNANPNIFGPVAAGSLGRFVAIFVIACPVFLRAKLKISHLAAATLLLGLYIILHSIFFSPFVLLSVLKGASWLLAMLSIAISFSMLSSEELRRFEAHSYFFLSMILILCIPAYLIFPGGQMAHYGYLRGMLGHSQAAGAFAALLAIWAYGRMLTEPKLTMTHLAIFGIGLTTAFMASTRTAVVAVLASLPLVTCIAATRKDKSIKYFKKRIFKADAVLILTAVIAMIILKIPAIVENFEGFLRKGTDATSVVDAYDQSRGVLLDTMIENISKNPIGGIGFGIASDPSAMEIEAIAGVPISAVVEKGVAHVAVWEELGIIGLLLYTFWLFAILLNISKSHVSRIGIFSVVILINFGDAYLFSTGGMGLLLLIFLGFSNYCVKRSPRRTLSPKAALERVEPSGSVPLRP